MISDGDAFSKTEYIKHLRTFEQLIKMAVSVSDASGGINTSNLGIAATKAYTRITLSAITIGSILPMNQVTRTCLWDFPSVASLARTCLETCHRYLYLSEKDLTTEDAEFRLSLYYYHLNCEKYRLYREFGASQDILSDFQKKLPSAKAVLMASPVYASLSQYMANKVKEGKTGMHFSDEEIAERHALIGGRFKPIYRLLSNHVHGTSFATNSQSNIRGRGIENPADVGYITLSLHLLNDYLAVSILKQIELLSLHQTCIKAAKYANNVRQSYNGQD